MYNQWQTEQYTRRKVKVQVIGGVSYDSKGKVA